MARLVLLAGHRERGESYRAVQGCNDWLRMGPGRSLSALYRRYTAGSTKKHQETPPTRSLNTLKKWASRYGWADRAETYDARREQIKNERAERIMASGLAQAHERVVELRHLAAMLLGELRHEEPNGELSHLWLRDVKQIGAGEDAEKVDIVRFNRAIVEAIRGLLNDLALETGGRTQKHDWTSGGQTLSQALEDAINKVYGDGDGE